MNVDKFIKRLQTIETGPNVANPYKCFEQGIDATNSASLQRSCQLSAYLQHRQNTAETILVAEAPGYQGARFSGIAMTSERMLSGQCKFVTEQEILGQVGVFRRTSAVDINQKKSVQLYGFAEQTATMVWKEIMRANRASTVVLWNTFPFHPYKENTLLSNRRPTKEEVNANAKVLNDFIRLFNPDCKIVAIGNVAKDHLEEAQVGADCVQHPANGGAAKFREQLRNLWN